MRRSVSLAKSDPGDLDGRIQLLKQKLYDIDQLLNGNRSKDEVGEKDRANVRNRMNFLFYGTSLATYRPTPALKEALTFARDELNGITKQLKEIHEAEIPAITAILTGIGAPWIEGQKLDE